MQTNFLRISAACVAAIATCSAMAQIKWAPNFATALKRAKSENKLVMVEFYADWDGNGKKLEADTFTQQPTLAVVNKMVPVRLNVDKEGKELVQKFHITNYPTVLFLDHSEGVVGIIDGYETSEEFVKHGNAFLKDYKELPGLEAKYKANSRNLDAVTRIGVIYADRYQISMALNKLSEAEKIDPSNRTDKLSDLYNAIGDYYQNASNFDPAIKYFEKGAATSKVTDKKAYGYLSIVACCFSLAQLDPGIQYETPITAEKARAFIQRAVPYLDACQKLPLKEDDKKIADSDRNVIRQVLGATGGG